MRKKRLQIARVVAFSITALLTASPTFADKPSWAGHGENDRRGQSGEQVYGGGNEQEQRVEHGRGERREHGEFRFDPRRRSAVRAYYAKEFRRGRCPPGLAKKHNGCMPPGQARKWAVGEPLPAELVRYDLTPTLVAQIGVPPAGYQYVRVASDILLIATGTGMVVDAINDLGRR